MVEKLVEEEAQKAAKKAKEEQKALDLQKQIEQDLKNSVFLESKIGNTKTKTISINEFFMAKRSSMPMV